MQHFMARGFSRKSSEVYTFTPVISTFSNGYVRDGSNGDTGSIAPGQHWNGATIVGVYQSDGDFSSPIPGVHSTLHVQFQCPGFAASAGVVSKFVKFGQIEFLNGDAYTYASATVIVTDAGPGRGQFFDFVWPRVNSGFGTRAPDGSITFIIRDYIPGAAPPPPPPQAFAAGVNLSGMEWAAPGIRFGSSTYPNLNYTVPRLATMQYLASQGVTLVRLPISWELLQPTRNSVPLISAATLAAYNTTSPAQTYTKGAFWEVYAQAIDKAFDDAATAGIKLILDLHNYCRYEDFVYDGSGNVLGLTNPADDVTPPYTTDNTKVRSTIFANAGVSPTLPLADFTDFWTKAATRWHLKSALGGYSLMNEPHDMPTATTNTAWNNPFINGNAQDYTIWPTYAQAAINAIRAVDSSGPIYVGGNDFQNPMNWATINPGFPLTGSGLIYDFHLYLDATSGGFRFDWDEEVAKGFSAGEGGATISTATGTNRIAPITAWKAAHGSPTLACTEFGLPIELRTSTGLIDQRWLDAGKATIDTLFNNNIQVFSWMGGDHWPIRGYPINHVPRWHQNQTVEPQVGAYLQAKLGTVHAVVFDEGPNYGTTVQTITVVARGYLPTGITVTVATDKGTLSKTTLTLAAGVNSSDTYTFTPPTDDKSTITYSRAGGAQVPPNRVFYSYADPATKAGISQADAALAIIAKYGAGLWLAEDGYTDYAGGVPCANGNQVRAVADKVGGGSTIENPLEMVNWFNTETPTSIRGIFDVALWNHDPDGFPAIDLTAGVRYGLYSKHLVPVNNPTATNPSQDNYPHPAAKSPFDLTDPHFGIVVFKMTGVASSGVLSAAQEMMAPSRSVLQLNAGKVEFQQSDINSVTATLTDTVTQPINTPVVASFASSATAQRLRVNSVDVLTGAHNWAAASPFSTLTWGSGHWNFFPQSAAAHYSHACVFGKGAIRNDEFTLIEGYLKTKAIVPPTLTGWELLVQNRFNAGDAGWWGDARNLAYFYTATDGSNIAPADFTSQIAVWRNRGNLTNAHDYRETNAGLRPNLATDAGGKHYLGEFSGHPITSNGGASTAFYIVIMVDDTQYKGVFFSDRNVANQGVRVRYDGDFGTYIAEIGKAGGLTTTLTVPMSWAGTLFQPPGKHIIECWYDGTNVGLRIDKSSTLVQTAVLGAAMVAGQANAQWGADVGNATPSDGKYYAGLNFKDFCPTSTDRDTIVTGIALDCGGMVV